MKPENFWDFLASKYDRTEGDPAVREDIPIIRKYLRPGDTVMDYACGTGTLALEIASQVKEINAVDISAKMLAAARSKAEERKIENIVFTQAILSDGQFRPGTFDAVLAFNILHLLEDGRGAVRRIGELLKPGGFFISNNPCLEEKPSLTSRLLLSLIRGASRIGIIPYVRLLKSSDLDDLLEGAGFRVVETKIFTGGAFGTTDYLIVVRNPGGDPPHRVEAHEENRL